MQNLVDHETSSIACLGLHVGISSIETPLVPWAFLGSSVRRSEMVLTFSTNEVSDFNDHRPPSLV